MHTWYVMMVYNTCLLHSSCIIETVIKPSAFKMVQRLKLFILTIVKMHEMKMLGSTRNKNTENYGSVTQINSNRD